MAFIHFFSGTVSIIILTTLYGPVLCLECISCEWSAGQEDAIGCVSTPYTENSTECGIAAGNFAFSCETRIKFREERGQHYLSEVSRKCELEHGDCNMHCDPRLRKDCYSCCSADNNCNSIPLSSAFLPRHFAYNITNHATSHTILYGSSLFQFHVLVLSFMSWCFVLWL